MQIKWRSAAMTHQGLRREENQDALVYSPENNLFSVSDGMGGVAYGRKTAMIVSTMMTAVAQRFAGWEGTSEALAETVSASVSSISDNIQQIGNPVGMRPAYGATLTGFLLHGDNAVIFNVGDSRVYRLRGEGPLEAMTVDHSVVQILVECGELTPEEARTYPGRSTVTRFMGMHPTVITDVKVEKILPGDIYLVCSDGLHSMVPDSGIRDILKEDLAPEEICAKLIDAANAGGGTDNISVVVWQSLTEEPVPLETSEEPSGTGEENANG